METQPPLPRLPKDLQNSVGPSLALQRDYHRGGVKDGVSGQPLASW